MQKSPKLVLKQVLDLPAAVAGFYVQDAVLTAIRTTEQTPLIFRLQDDINTLKDLHTKYTAKLAGAFFDYIALAAFGEARHAPNMAKRYIHQICYKWNRKSDSEAVQARTDSYRHALKFDPWKFLPVLEILFEDGEWTDSAYGGNKWADICNAGMDYHQVPDTVFVDQAVDLSHNSGSMFNKDVLFQHYDISNYLYMLDRKRSMTSILVENFLKNFRVSSLTKRFLKMAAKLGLMDPELVYAPPVYIDIEFPDVVKWGMLPITEKDLKWSSDLQSELALNEGESKSEEFLFSKARLSHLKKALDTHIFDSYKVPEQEALF